MRTLNLLVGAAAVFAAGLGSVQAQEGVKTRSAVSESFDRAGAEAAKGDFAAAIADYSKVVELEPKNSGALNGRGIAEDAGGDHVSAIADFDKALALDPANAALYVSRAQAKASLADRAGALADFDKALAHDPASALDYVFRGRAKQNFDDDAGAEADFTKAASLEPKMALAYAYRASERYDRLAWKDALEDYRKVCELTPSHQDYARLRIWLIRARTGERAAADAELSRFLAEKDVPGQEWLRDIGAFLLARESDADQLAKLVSSIALQADPGRRGVVYFFAGTKRLIDGDKAAAVEILKECLATGRKGKQSYRSATLELKRIRQ
ncbi:MAG: tetratricopeptide repeat protein [Elusimicrobiota bacterium]